MSEDDCLGCRLVSGGGVCLGGLYIWSQAANKTRGNKIGLYVVAAAFGSVGVARLFNFGINFKSKRNEKN